MMLVRVEAPHFIAGLALNESGVCVEAAPILRWCIGKKAPFLRHHFHRNGWLAAIIKPREERT